ncbi:MAG: 2-oxo acid dehydrogenase subunit E2 [Holosporales bacterium]|nr:2-oxo acid dehydrogenase subunit E2 [Holosporales bacterium]
MPSLSPTMKKGNLVAWCKKEGDEISVGDVILEIDTDKVTMEVESVYSGVLSKIIVQSGTHDVLVKTPIAIIRQKNDADESVKNLFDSLSKPVITENTKVAATKRVIEVNVQKNETEPLRISPLAKRIANEYGIDISNIAGTGPRGRIIKEDILKMKQVLDEGGDNSSNSPKFTDESLSQMRHTIAEKLTNSKQNTPHFYMATSINVTNLLAFRKGINDSGKFHTKLTINDLIIKAVAFSMKDEPLINVMWNDGFIRRFNTVDIAIAVAIDDGLLTPIIQNADIKSVLSISSEVKGLVKRAKMKELKPEEFVGGGITISNLGMYDIDSFFSIINPPQGSILSIGTAKKTPICDQDENLIFADMINVGYAVDHRVINGENAARFLKTLTRYLENPALLLI